MTYTARATMTASINRKANDMILGKIEEICNENEIIYNYEINEKFVVEAIGKATPKKPKWDKEMMEIGSLYWNCPSCMTRYGSGGKIVTEVPYCSVCGQKIDWESED